MTAREVNAALGVLGVVAVGILSMWFPTAMLGVPMPKGVLASTALTTVWGIVALGVFPYLWAIRRLGMTLGDLGISVRRLGLSTVLGCALYALALVAFLHCSWGQMMSEHAVRSAPPGPAIFMAFCMSVTAAGTDLLTRGFILLSLARHGPVTFAIAAQNGIWYLGHTHEIGLLADCLGVGGATLLTLTLGIGGDMVVLRTRNVIGLCIAHVLLNVILTIYLRSM
ncbi:MAG TPA: CPBP family glutamic-type intramembrane protease [Gemmatimonadales bacterium]